jgi:hypothetical protein
VGSIVAVTGHFSTVGIGLAWAGSIAGGDVRKGASSILLSSYEIKGKSLRSDPCFGYYNGKSWRVRYSPIRQVEHI